MKAIRPRRFAFTLVELLVVISIIAVLASLTFTGVQQALLAAKKVSAKNDMAQLANAVQFYYTEYGKYPSGSLTSSTTDTTFTTNGAIVSILRYKWATGTADPTSENQRQIQFLQPKVVNASTVVKGAVNQTDGNWYDPWGNQYVLFIDSDYSGSLDTVPTFFTDITTAPSFGVGVASCGLYYSKKGAVPSSASPHLFNDTSSGGLKNTNLISWQ